MKQSRRVAAALVICSILLGEASASATMTVPLQRKAVGISASETKQKIQSQLLKSGGFSHMFGQKNIDNHGPIEDILDDFGTDDGQDQNKSLFGWISDWIMDFAPKTASPYRSTIHPEAQIFDGH